MIIGAALPCTLVVRAVLRVKYTKGVGHTVKSLFGFKSHKLGKEPGMLHPHMYKQCATKKCEGQQASYGDVFSYSSQEPISAAESCEACRSTWKMHGSLHGISGDVQTGAQLLSCCCMFCT